MSDAFAALWAACAADPPHAAVVLGSGLGPVARNLAPRITVPFTDLPGLPAPSVPGHGGRFTLGDWAGRRVLLVEGRVHRYEGHPWDVVVRPVSLACLLGARVVLLTNAAGGIHDELHPGRLMAIRDHLDCTGAVWWRSFGTPQPSAYAPRLLALLSEVAAEVGIPLHQGVYAQLTGPCYETPAEIRALRACGADAVGMSTAVEALTACVFGRECAAVSCITNRAAGLSAASLDHREVLSTAAAQADLLGRLLDRFLACVNV